MPNYTSKEADVVIVGAGHNALVCATSHLGGSVSGRPGRNTARVVLDDLKIDASSFMRRP